MLKLGAVEGSEAWELQSVAKGGSILSTAGMSGIVFNSQSCVAFESEALESTALTVSFDSRLRNQCIRVQA